jgi:hypothetical protein
MLSESRFGAAVSFSVRAGDKRQLRVITDAILDVYIREGKLPSASVRVIMLTKALGRRSRSVREKCAEYTDVFPDGTRGTRFPRPTVRER